MILITEKTPGYKIWYAVFWAFNPFPQRVRVKMDVGYLRDRRKQWISDWREKKERERRRLNNEEEQKCFQATLKGSVGMRSSIG